jgi:DNA-binding transcriptional regulator YiaG
MRRKKVKDPDVRWLIDLKRTTEWSYSRVAQELKISKETVFSWFRAETRPSPLARMRIKALRKRLGSMKGEQQGKKSARESKHG